MRPSQVVIAIISITILISVCTHAQMQKKPPTCLRCLRNFFSCKRKFEEDCCAKYRQCAKHCGLKAPTCSDGKRGSWNKRYDSSLEDYYPYL